MLANLFLSQVFTKLRFSLQAVACIRRLSVISYVTCLKPEAKSKSRNEMIVLIP